ncbi:hypothetical protein GF385_01860 [Candidatus Dependentiae bacterium]|nr:hypothetical protein [Candidatus Dependentiae bacterium]
MDILILRVSAIGDVIHTLPSIFFIKKVLPNAKISWIVQKKAADLLINQPFLENVYVLPDKFLYPHHLLKILKLIKKINKTRWDMIIDFQGILKTSIFAYFIKGKKIGFDKKNARLGITTFFTNKQIKPKYKNIIQKNLNLTSGTLQEILKNNFKKCPTIDSIKKNFKLKIKSKDKVIINNWLKKNDIKKFIILSPNTTWPSKHWPVENWKNLITILTKNNLNNNSIILLGKDFGAQAKNIFEYCKKNKIRILFSPKWNLIQTSYLISLVNLLVAPDTGILHIADFLGKKSIGIFGPTSAKKHGPFLLQNNISNAIQIKCPHFYKKTHGKLKTSGNKTNCMYKLNAETLAKKILKIIKKEK